jgi:hypothetical protein
MKKAKNTDLTADEDTVDKQTVSRRLHVTLMPLTD